MQNNMTPASVQVSGGTGCSCGSQKAPHFPEQVTGMDILARALKNIGIETMYGLVGIPVTEMAYIAQGQGVRFISFRHEQQAGMAAATHDRQTGRVADCFIARIHKRAYGDCKCHGQLLSYDSDFRLVGA